MPESSGVSVRFRFVEDFGVVLMEGGVVAFTATDDEEADDGMRGAIGCMTVCAIVVVVEDMTMVDTKFARFVWGERSARPSNEWDYLSKECACRAFRFGNILVSIPAHLCGSPARDSVRHAASSLKSCQHFTQHFDLNARR